MKKESASGVVKKAFGNLIHVTFQGAIRQGEVAFVHVGDLSLKAEVIEIAGNEAKLQVFEDTRGVKLGSTVSFSSDLLEAELGPGLLESITDGLQNPLEELCGDSEVFLPRGVYPAPLNRTKKWKYTSEVRVDDKVVAGDVLGFVPESRFEHKIMVPFGLKGTYTISWIKENGSYTVDTVIAKATDEDGREYEWKMVQRWPIKAPLMIGEKIKASEKMGTGLRVLDTLFPLIKGGTFCSPGPFGAGKTVIQHHLAKYSAVDIVVVVACGERAGEVVEVLQEFPHLEDPHTKEPLITRTVIICNTSSMPVAAREASVYLGATIGEYYRQMGLDVLVLADSTSRWAQAMREMSGRLEEIPGEEAFPAYLASRIAAFYERSGLLNLKGGKRGSLTIGGAVSPAGGNFEEPVTQATLAVVGAFLGLSKARSDARRYPAIDPLISWSKYVSDVAKGMKNIAFNWGEKVTFSYSLLKQGEEIGKRMEVVGEEGTPIDDLVTFLKAELFDFVLLQQNAFDDTDKYCESEKQTPLFELVLSIAEKKFHFESREKARSYFLEIQAFLKNTNYLQFGSEQYKQAMALALDMIDNYTAVRS